MIHFALIVPGWRCARYVARCWQSIVTQEPGGYTWEAHLYDDGSIDATGLALVDLPEDPRLRRYISGRNLGAAHARHFLIRRIADPSAVCVLLDLDDQLLPGALARVAQEYEEHPETWVTYGSWRPDRWTGNAQAADQRPYADEVKAARSYRSEAFLAAPLRTFRRHLADGVPASYLQDAEGEWLRACTDAALMFALLEQCEPHRVRYIPEVLYRYTWRRDRGTVRRYGVPYKKAIRAHLARMAPLSLRLDYPPPP